LCSNTGQFHMRNGRDVLRHMVWHARGRLEPNKNKCFDQEKTISILPFSDAWLDGCMESQGRKLLALPSTIIMYQFGQSLTWIQRPGQKETMHTKYRK
jgi:hypothetical protein